ncbi:MAG: transporter substrate-binding domain-containing protein [Chromatiales bacterium]|jgi:ABC-type amino acid transport substrate-binding protein|nr:transporter substrate-binding domain-containing protein [Chromatiales bacterium]
MLLGAVVCSTASAAEGRRLTVCLEEDSPPYSFKFGKRTGGFEYDLAHLLGRKLKREVAIQWFEFEVDEDEVTTLQANALLADGRCDVIGGYPLLESWLGTPKHAESVLPDYAGKKRSERHRRVKLGTVVATKPYLRSQFGVINGPGFSGPIGSLEDLEKLSVMVEIQSLPAIILWRHKDGLLMDNLTHVAPTKGLLKQMDDGGADVTFVEVHRFDRYRLRNPETKLRWSGYVHPIGYNFGYAALATRSALVEDINGVLDALAKSGSLQKIASDNALTYFAPTEPHVAGKLKLN